MKTTLKTTTRAVAMVAAMFLSLIALAPHSGAQATDGASTDGYVPSGDTDGDLAGPTSVPLNPTTTPIGPTATVLSPGTDGGAATDGGSVAAANTAAAPVAAAALPLTGGNSMETAQLAFGLVAAGGVFILMGRRRSQND